MGYDKGAQSHGHPDTGEVKSHQEDRVGFKEVAMPWVLKDGWEQRRTIQAEGRYV